MSVLYRDHDVYIIL